MSARSGRRLACALAASAALAASLAAQIDPFYLDIERDALAAVARDDAAAAARLYRIACFGMLDEPARLAGCTVGLALAQAAAGDREGFGESWSRLATVEERFQGLSRAAVAEATRRELAKRAAAWLPAETLRSIPDLATLAAVERAAAAERELTPRERRRRDAQAAEVAAAGAKVAPPANAAPPPAKTPPKPLPKKPAPPAAKAPTAATTKEPPKPTPEASAPPPEPAEAATPASAPAPPAAAPALTSAELERVAAARALFAGNPDRAALDAEIARLRPVADGHPDSPELARLVGDLAYRAGAWPLCADYHARAGDPGPAAPLARFYMAVCLYESGRREAAAALLAPSVSALRRSPFVDGYVGKILGPGRVP